MSLSIRNQLPATVTGITTGEAMAIVRTRLDGGQELTAAVTREAVEDLGLAPGSLVHALVKSTDIALSTAPLDGVSIRNQLPGTIARIAAGPALSALTLTAEGTRLTAVITTESAEELGLRVGTFVVALLKSTQVALATR